MAKPKNKVKFNLKNVYYAVQNRTEDGALTYAAPKHIPGAVNINLTPQGESNTFYADGIAYYVSNANSGYHGDLEVALIPDSFAVDVLKERLDEADQVLVERSDVETAVFALLFQFDGDIHGVRHVLYNCTVARPNITGATTTNTKEPQTASMAITAAPMADGRVKARTTADTPDATYNGWFDAVWEPKAPEVYDAGAAEPLPSMGAA